MALLWSLNWLIGKALNPVLPGDSSYLNNPVLVVVVWFIMGFVGSLLTHLLFHLPPGHNSEWIVLMPMFTFLFLGIASAFIVAMPGRASATFAIAGAMGGLIAGLSRTHDT